MTAKTVMAYTTVLFLCYEVIEKQVRREMVEKYSIMNLHTLMH